MDTMAHAMTNISTPGHPMMANMTNTPQTQQPVQFGSTSKQLFSSPGFNNTVNSVTKPHNNSQGQEANHSGL